MGANKKRELLFTTDPSSDQPLYRQIYTQTQNAIVKGRLHAGDRLPSIRSLAKDLSLSHTTIEQAYLQLSVEGYVRNIPRSGYVVEALDTRFLNLPKESNIEASVQRALDARITDAFAFENVSGRKALYDFSYANLPSDSFPATTWRRIVSDVLYANTSPELATYSYTQEPNELRKQIASYLVRARGANCIADQVVLQAGTDSALATILELFDSRSHTFGMEEPGYATAIETAKRMGFNLVPLPIDKGADRFIAALEEHKPKIVFCTPSHQFPTGAVMHLETRTRLLQWAQARNAYIIEDDSCNEYRYDTAPIPSLQSLDAYHRVIYLGNVSKVLSPALRIAFLVLPPKLLGRYLRLFNYAHPPISYLEQEVLARFMEQGHWDAHIRRMAQTMHKRHNVLLRCLEDEFGHTLTISGKHAGMHLYVSVENNMTQPELIASAAQEGAAIYSTQRMWFSRRKPTQNVIIGFSSIPVEDIPNGVAALKRAWAG